MIWVMYLACILFNIHSESRALVTDPTEVPADFNPTLLNLNYTPPLEDPIDTPELHMTSDKQGKDPEPIIGI